MPSFSTSLALFLLTITVATATATAKEFEVGDDVGWRIPATNETELYNVWASRRRFHIGDSLRFHYKNDSVAMVEKSEFYHCDSSKAISSYNDGNTVINLDKLGKSYFVSGKADRCNKGQKMIVNVMSLHHLPPPIATPPLGPYNAMAPSPSQFSGSGSSSSGPAYSASLSFVFFMVILAGLGLCMVHP